VVPQSRDRLEARHAVVERASKSPRLQRRAEREVSLEAQVALLQHRLAQLELRLVALEHHGGDVAAR
jgi:transposase